jgi:hypothetical protein
MDEDLDLDRRLAGWMRNGPNAAPRDVVERALVETTTVVQVPKRGGGSATSALRALVIGTLLGLIVLFLAVGLAVIVLR